MLKINTETKIKYIVVEFIENKQDESCEPGVFSGMYLGETKGFYVINNSEKTMALCIKYYNILSIGVEYEKTQTMIVFTNSEEDQIEAMGALVELVKDLNEKGYCRGNLLDKSKLDVLHYTSQEDTGKEGFLTNRVSSKTAENKDKKADNVVSYKKYILVKISGPDPNVLEEMRKKIGAVMKSNEPSIPYIDKKHLSDCYYESGVMGYCG